MLINTDDLVSVTDLARNLSRYIAQTSQDGRRVVIMNNNVPTAAIISMTDLQHLIALDEHASAPPVADPTSTTEQNRHRPTLSELGTTPGTSTLGCTHDGTPITWNLSQHHILIGQRNEGRDSALSAAIATATAKPGQPVDLVVATARPMLPLDHSTIGDVRVAVHCGIDNPDNLRLFTEILEAEITERTTLLADQHVLSMTDYRAATGTDKADLVVVVDGLDELDDDSQRQLHALLTKVSERGDNLGISLWHSAAKLNLLQADSFAADIPDHCAVRTRTAAESRMAIGTDAAHRLDPGHILRKNSPSGILTRGLITEPDLDQRIALTPTTEPTTSWNLRLNAPIYLDELNQPGPDTQTRTLPLTLGITDPQRRPLQIDLGAETNVLFAGRSDSGLSTAVLTLITTAATTHPPQTCSFHILDYNTSGDLAPLETLPNVGAYATHRDHDKCRRILGEYERILDLRTANTPESDADDPYGRMILVIDNAARFFDAPAADAHTALLLRLAKTGPQHGLHVLMAADPGTIPIKVLMSLTPTLLFAGADRAGLLGLTPDIKDLLRSIPDNQPGRCISATQRAAGRIALPYNNPGETAQPLTIGEAAERLRQTVDHITSASTVQKIPELRTVPNLIPFAQAWTDFEQATNRDLKRTATNDRQTPSPIEPLVGIDINDCRPASIPNYTQCGHLLIVGNQKSGRTSTLRSLIASITRQFESDNGVERPRLAIIDTNMELADLATQLQANGMLLGYGPDSESAAQLLTKVETTIRRPVPTDVDTLTLVQIRDRMTYSGPEIFVIIDDDRFPAGSHFGPNTGPLSNLLELTERNTPGLHIFATLPSHNYSTTRLTNTITKSLERAGAPTLMLSGSPAEGTIWHGTGIKFQHRNPGQGMLVDILGASRSRIIQVPWLEPGAQLAPQTENAKEAASE